MCGRYWIEQDESFPMPANETAKTSGEVYPGDTVPVICFSKAGNIRTFAMNWGWELNRSGKKLINIRSETVWEKPVFAESMAKRRCLLPMSYYFEWHKRGKDRIKYRIMPEGQGTYYLAGLYRFEERGPVCSVLTTDADETISFIHSRMPVIIDGASAQQWLRDERPILKTTCAMDFMLA